LDRVITRDVERGFWNERWREGRIGFHASDVNPALERHADFVLDASANAANARVLVPLCGKSLDLPFLAERGAELVGVEFVELAVQQFFDERGLAAEVRAARPDARHPVYSAGPYRILVGDFFSVTPGEAGPISGIYDRAALVAVKPEQRAAYAAKLGELTAPGAPLLLVNFIHDLPDGPPFSISESELSNHFEPYFEMKLVEEQETLEAESRFRDRGATTFREQVWHGRRRASTP
jgi:thiopurine S-methyltransferase